MKPKPLPDDDARFIRLEGAYNFRDIGGYVALGGRRVASGRVFRAGTLSNLTEADQRTIRGLGIRMVCDFRGNDERVKRPSRLPIDANIEIWMRDHEFSAGNLMREINSTGATAERSRERMLTLYRSLAIDHAETYAELFRRLASGPLPLVFHCAAGKDRTGVATALLLDWLGVARGEIAEDYALTDLFYDNGVEMIIRDYGDLLPRSAVKNWAPLLRADKVYIETMFATVEAAYGSVEAYLRDTLLLDEQTLAQVRDQLLV